MPTRVFNYTGGWQRFNIPKGVSIVDIVAVGGGTETAQAGRVSGRLRVKDDQVLWILCGAKGNPASGRNGGGDAIGGGRSGGDGGAGRPGGEGGGGATVIRMNGRDGNIRCVAGGAGGKSGDNGPGGMGGQATGQNGFPGNAGNGPVGNATGGTQTQGGKGGTSSAGSAFRGRDANNVRAGGAGRGGGPGVAGSIGGGGGGGGFYCGGGGQAGLLNVTPGGGGAGGSNFSNAMFSVDAMRGGGGHGDGRVTIHWDDPKGNTTPTGPTNITIDGKPIQNGLATKARNEVVVRGDPNDPDNGQDVRLVVRYSTDRQFTHYRGKPGSFDPATQMDKVHLQNLKEDTRYWLRIHTQDSRGQISRVYRTTNFWMNRSPREPELRSPAPGTQVTSLMNVTFEWRHRDLDPDDPQTAWQLRWRTAETPTAPAGKWSDPIRQNNAANTHTVSAGTFRGNTFYQWQVRTRDGQFKWGAWGTGTFFVTAEATPPILLEPVKNEAFPAGQVKRFRWKFRGPQHDVAQNRLDIQYRVVGTEAWTTLFGEVDPGQPGTNQFWDIPEDTFAAQVNYEWRARSYSSLGFTSDWSESDFFWTTYTPGSGAGIEIISSDVPQEHLGEGDNRVFVYDRGGQTLRGEITPIADVQWTRKRDDISNLVLHVKEWDSTTREFLAGLRSWIHELVVFRDGKRVWEGPITRISGNQDNLEIEAKDVMAYVYRRVMRQGYNDAYRMMNGQQLGLKTVVERATQIILNALAYDDPNVLAYMTPLEWPDDARTSRVRKDYTLTAWEEVDDLAARAGLDYTVSGRRIVLWDTHRPIGRLPELRDGDFSEAPVVSEYGMSMANFFAVTNGNGIWGAAARGLDPVTGLPGSEGFIEQLATSYGESQGAGTEQTLTRTARRELERSLTEQAERNISGRWPHPVVVRIPDNATLNPELNLGINQLIPGVWVPLRSTGGVRELSQWQKLDSVTVKQDGEGEKIAVVMSPAPNEGQDPDADAAQEEE